MPKRATRKGVTPAKRSPKRKKPTPRAATPKPDARAPGRPSTYDPKYCTDVVDYFRPKEPKVKVFTDGDKSVMQLQNPTVPLLDGFAAEIGVHRDTVHQWAKVHPEFSDALKRAKCFQAATLNEYVQRGYLPPSWAIFYSKNTMGWRDKTALVGGEEEEGDKPVQVTHDLPPEVKEAMARVSLRAKAVAAGSKR